MMIVTLILSMQLLAAAVPITELDPFVIDGVGGMVFEIPEYEDPEWMDYEISAMGGLPVLSLIELPKTGSKSHLTSIKDAKAEGKGDTADTVLELGEIIKDLQRIHANLHSESGSNRREELGKAIHDFKKLKDSFITPDIRGLLTAIQRSLSIPESFIITATKKSSMPAVINDYLDEVDTRKPAPSENGTVVADFNIEKEVKAASSPFELNLKDPKREEVGVKAFKSKWTFNIPL